MGRMLALPFILKSAKLQLKSAQTITNNSSPDISWQTDSALWDIGGWYNFGAHPTRLTCPTGGAGRYVVTAGTLWAADGSGSRIIEVVHNNSGSSLVNFADDSRMTVTGGNGIVITIATIFNLTVGDYVSLGVSLSSASGNVNVSAGDRTFLALSRVG